MFLNAPISALRRRAARRELHQRRADEYRRRVALGEPPLRAAERTMPPREVRPPAPPVERTLVALEGGKGNPKRQGAIYVFGRGDGPIRKDVIA